MAMSRLKGACEGFTSGVTLNVSDSVKNIPVDQPGSFISTNPRDLSEAQGQLVSVACGYC